VRFPTVAHGASSPRYLYAIVSNISIYSSHVQSALENCILSVFGRSIAAERSRARRVLKARQTAIYLANVTFGLTYTEIGLLFRRDRRAVARTCALVEDLRDDPGIDWVLTALEFALLRLSAEFPKLTTETSPENLPIIAIKR
jgi:hypothetical protein